MADQKNPTVEPAPIDEGDEAAFTEVSSTIDDCNKLIDLLRDMKYDLLFKMMKAEEKIEEYRIHTETCNWEPQVLFHRQVTYRLKMILMKERETKVVTKMRIYDKWIAHYSKEKDEALTRKLELIRRRERLEKDAVFCQPRYAKKH